MILPTKLYEEGNFALYTHRDNGDHPYWWIRTVSEPIMWIMVYYSGTRQTLFNDTNRLTYNTLKAQIPEKIIFMFNCIKSNL